MEENKKEIKEVKQTNYNAIIMTILLLLVIGMTSFIITDKFLTEEKKCDCKCPKCVSTQAPQSVDRENLSINDPTVQKLIKTFDITLKNNYVIDEWKPTLLNDSEYRLSIVYKNLEKTAIIESNCNNYYWNDKYYSACGDKTVPDDETAYAEYSNESRKNAPTLIIKEKDIKDKYEELFGSNYEYKPQGFYENICATHCFNYYEETKEYVMHRCGSGCAAGPGKHTITSAYKKDDKLYIETDLITNLDTKKENKKHYIYEFKLENGNYTFVKVTENN